MSIERLTGMEIDDDCGLPREMVCCPGCGRRYLNKKIKWVCKECEECSKCCNCGGPHITPPEMIKFVEENT